MANHAQGKKSYSHMKPQAQVIWEGLQFRAPAMLTIVERLSDRELRWQPPNDANPIAWMLWHIPEVEDNWVRDRLYGLPKRYPFGASVKSTPIGQFPPKARLLDYFHEVRAVSYTHLTLPTNREV